MNWVDLVVLGVILVSGFLAFARGLVREVLGLGAWLVAAFVASPLGLNPLVQPWVNQHITDPVLAQTLAFIGVFVVVLILLSLIASAIAGAIRGSVLGSLDRTLGLVFGLLRGALLTCAAYIVVGLAIPVEQWPAPVLEARALPIVYRGSAWIVDHVPNWIPRPAVAPPPGRPASSAELLHANPVGRATNARTPRE